MSIQKSSISTPQSSAGIIGITSTTNIGGWKFDPKWVVIIAVAIVVVVKVLDIILGTNNL